ncbi:EscU/YscU/HrcU family type III secretion system export apparatus switch protein [Candidatus Margulisiibacteriota bacterium]
MARQKSRAKSKSKELLKKSKKLKKHLDELDLPEREKLKAVAIKYNVKKDKAPKIIAAGKGVIAERILKIADEFDIPFFEDQALTELLSKIDLNANVPAELFTLVAEVLAFVYQLDKMAQKRKELQDKRRSDR